MARLLKSGKGYKFLHSVLMGNTESCVEWPFYKMPNGYAQLGTSTGMVLAHRYICIEAHGEPESDDQQALHKCGNRACVNPNHIRWGTQKDNEDDKKGHGTWYSRISNARLTEKIVRRIRRDHAAGKSYADLVKKYKTPRSTIRKVVCRYTWKHIN